MRVPIQAGAGAVTAAAATSASGLELLMRKRETAFRNRLSAGTMAAPAPAHPAGNEPGLDGLPDELLADILLHVEFQRR